MNKISPIFWIFLIPLILLGLFLLIPILFVGLFLAGIYYGYKKLKKGISETIRNLRKRKIKITDTSENGDVKINFIHENDQKIEVEVKNLQNETSNEKWEIKQFTNYLKNYGLYECDGKLYYFDKSVFPVYKKSYPVNEVIKLYDSEIDADMLVLGLKGESDDPKFLYLVPKGVYMQRMTVEELKKYEVNLKNQEINNFN